MKCYTGYVVGKNESNPISVWIPARSGGNIKWGVNRGFGTNAGNMSLSDLIMMRSNSDKCYITCELNPKSSYHYNDENGYATVEDHLPVLDATTARDVRNVDSVPVRSSSPGEGQFYKIPHADPAENWLQTYVPWDSQGIERINYDNAPGGNFCTLSIGTKVLVVFPDGKGIGYIIRQIPYEDDYSKLIRNLDN